MTTIELKDIIGKLLEHLNDNSFRDARTVSVRRKELFENFRHTNFVNSQERQEIWNKVQELLDIFKEKQQELAEASEKVAIEAEKMIDKIRELTGDESAPKQFVKEDFTELKKQLTAVAEFIRQSDWPSRERRIKAWERLRNYQELLKKREDAFYTKMREEKNRYMQNSESLMQAILYATRICHPKTANGNLDELFGIMSSLVPSWPNAGDSGYDAAKHLQENKNPLKIKSEALKELRRLMSEKKDEITREDKQKIYAAIDEVQEEQDKAWSVYKEELKRKKAEWEEKKKERELKRMEWEQRQKDFLAKLEDRLAKQTSFKEVLLNVYEKQKSFVERLGKRMIQQQDFLLKLDDQLAGLEEKYEMTTDGKFREKLSEWIKDKYSKITEVENDINDMDTKIKNAQKNIDELPGKISEIELTLIEIRDKINEVHDNLNLKNHKEEKKSVSPTSLLLNQQGNFSISAEGLSRSS